MTMYGPFSRVTDDGAVYTSRTWYRNKPVTDAPSPFTFDRYFAISMPAPGLNTSFWRSWDANANTGSEMDRAVNLAYDRFVNETKTLTAGEDSALGANLATWRMSFNMITDRAIQLRKSVNLLRQGNYVGAAKSLRVRPPSTKSKLKGYSAVWLEWSYGWKPLVQDIHDAVEILQGQMTGDGKICRGRATLRSDNTWNSGPYYYATWSRNIRTSKAQVQARVRITNPNLYRANKLGLLNPATVLWEVIPFSFAVDWFVPVGRFLESFTDLVGVSMDNAFTTKYGVLDDIVWRNDRPQDGKIGKRRVQVARTLGIPAYKLKPRFTGFASARGANAIALLISSLKSLK